MASTYFVETELAGLPGTTPCPGVRKGDTIIKATGCSRPRREYWKGVTAADNFDCTGCIVPRVVWDGLIHLKAPLKGTVTLLIERG